VSAKFIEKVEMRAKKEIKGVGRKGNVCFLNPQFWKKYQEHSSELMSLCSMQ